MYPPPNIRHLSALTEINRLGSISRAAAAVHLSQPAITQGLTKIEASLGSALFERGANGMFATEAGALFLARVERAIQYLRTIDREVGREAGPGRLYHLLTTAQLRTLIAVVEHGSFSLAAAALDLAQPTVHRAAREVEALCGRELFVRSSSGVDPTTLARRLARLASLAFAEIRQGYDEVGEQRGAMTGRLAIGSLPLARSHLVPASVTQLLQHYPEANVSIIDGPYDELLNSLLHSRVDMILGAVRQPPPVREIHQEVLFDDPMAVVVRAGHPLLKTSHLDLNTLASLDWIAPRPGTPARKRFADLFTSHGLAAPSHVIECSSSVATRGLLLQSDRAALLSARQVQTELQAQLLATLPIPLDVSRPIGLTLRNNWKPTAMQAAYLSLLKTIAVDYAA